MDTTHLDCDCTSKCRSKQHALDLLTLVTRGNLSQVQAYFSHCYNSCIITDEFGRNVLHMAASCRKWEIVDWLLTEKKINHQVKDIESGWTALHRSLFYGQITSALHLIHHGASLTSQDKESLTPLDIIRLDRPAYVEFQPTGPTDVYTWGTNANFTLGHSNQQSRKHPDLVEEFAKKSISIKQVVVCKYHSVFLSHNSQVYTCGHGQGGRLGLGNEQTYLSPTRLDSMVDIKCTHIAAARDHTVMLAEGGVVYTCGLNSCHQLGQPQLGSKYTTPKPILTKPLKVKVITGIEACRFHTVLYCSDTVFTFGLNAGQLGFPKGEKYIPHPKKVSSLDHKDTVISRVAASAAVTVCSTIKGDLYILHEYQCKKIATKQLNVIKLVAHGGNLDNDVDRDLLQREKRDELTVLALTASGKVFCWKRSDRSVLKRCCWNYSREIFMSDMTISKQHMAFITPHGEAFMACFSKKKTKTSSVPSLLARSPSVEAFTLSAEVELLEKEETEEIALQRLTLVNRAVRITSDPSGQNFAVLQSDPKTSLIDVPNVSDSGIGNQFKTFLEETNSLDNIHDIILKVQGHEIPAHKYILASRCEYFRKILSLQKSEDLGRKYKVDSSSGRPVQVIEVEKANYEMFLMLVQYIYTEHCEILNPGYKVKPSKKSGGETVDSGIDFDLDADFDELDIHDIDGGRKSAFEIRKGDKKIKTENKKSGKKRKKSLNEDDENDKKVISGPVKNLQSLAKKFGVPGLANRLDSAKCSKGVIYGIKKPFKKLRFERTKHRHLCDVSIQADDGEAIQCHKCILVARLEYFRSMLGSGWVETSTNSPLHLPLSGNILRIMLEYLYTDDAVTVRECTNVELLCNALAVADQFLMLRLKEICEVALANSITMRNVAELLDFATVYNSRQLKNTCIQFIGLNLATLLELRTLEILSEDILEEVSTGYKQMIPSMCRRIITPYSLDSDPDYFVFEMGENVMETEKDDQNVQYEVTTPYQSSKKMKWKKKSRKRTTSTEKDDSIQSNMTASPEDSVAMETGDLSPRDDVSQELLKGSTAEELMEDDEDLPSAISCNVVSLSVGIPESNETTQLQPTVWGVQSPTSPVGPSSTDLRSIMEVESSRNKCHSAQKTSVILTHGKLSQKQRKKLARQQQIVKVDVSEAGNTESEKNSVAKSPVYAWGAVPKSPSAKSFRELQLEDEKHQHQMVDARRSASVVLATSPSPPLPPVSSREKMLSWGITSRIRRTSEDDVSTSPASSPQSPSSEILCPWKQSPSPKSPSTHTVRFADIMQAEVKQTETLEKNMRKPFHLIQIEERAIQELLTHYNAADNSTEYIGVGRDSSMMAIPIWKK